MRQNKKPSIKNSTNIKKEPYDKNYLFVITTCIKVQHRQPICSQKIVDHIAINCSSCPRVRPSS
jgi:hypothetical protein